jgi:salicylate hydroxylase
MTAHSVSTAHSAYSVPRIAVLGGGIGGLAAAAFLHLAGIACTVYEQARELREVGAGLVLAPNAIRALRKLGVMNDLATRAVRLDIGWEFRRWQDGTVLSSEDLAGRSGHLYGEHTHTAHRADLLEVLRLAVPATSIELGRKCVDVSITPNDPLRLVFSDGSSVSPDVVIAADGIHSIVRAAVGEAAAPEFSGLCAFRGLVPVEQAPALARRNAQTLWIGPGHHLVHYPVSGGTLVNLVAIAPAGDFRVESWSATATPEEFRAEFDGWDPRLIDLIQAAGAPGRWALLDRAPLPRWSHGRVTLLGDAAHPMMPFFGQGAAQAIEDAAVLARCLATDLADPARALERYEAARRPRTTRMQEVSRGRGDSNHLPDGPEQEARDKSFADADHLVASAWIYAYDTDAD